MKKLILIILFSFFFSSCSLLEDFENNSEVIDISSLPRVNLTSSPDVYMCPQDDCLNVILNFLVTAENGIKCAFYELDNLEISNLLIEKNTLGVDVKIIVDNEYLEEESILDLEHNDVSVRSDLNRGTTYNNYMHHKFCIIDDSKLLLSSANPTQNGMFYNNNNILVFDSFELSLEFEKEFEQLFSGTFGYNKKSLREIKGVDFNGSTLDIYMCPQDECAQVLENVLLSAKEEIFFANFVLTLDSAEEILIDKKSLGVNVSGVIESRMWNSKGSRAEELSKLFPLVKDSNSKTMHHKFFIVDSRFVVTGSMNPSKSGTSYNDEFLVVIDSEKIASEYVEEFLSLIKTDS